MSKFPRRFPARDRRFNQSVLQSCEGTRGGSQARKRLNSMDPLLNEAKTWKVVCRKSNKSILRLHSPRYRDDENGHTLFAILRRRLFLSLDTVAEFSSSKRY